MCVVCCTECGCAGGVHGSLQGGEGEGSQEEEEEGSEEVGEGRGHTSRGERGGEEPTLTLPPSCLLLQETEALTAADEIPHVASLSGKSKLRFALHLLEGGD